MKTKEAIERVKSRFNKWALDNEDLAALQVLGLVDAESENEKVRKELIEYLTHRAKVTLFIDEDKDCKRWIAYLEKQKDASKAIEAVEKIDKYIDAHTANVHDMDDSNPDKKYYSGVVDDTLSDIAGILTGTYSEEKQKEQQLSSDSSSSDDDVQIKKYAEKIESETGSSRYSAKDCDNKQGWSKEDKDTIEKTICILETNFKPNEGFIGFNINRNQLVERLKSLSLQPKQEWSEEDEDYLRDVKCAVYDYFDEGYAEELCNWLHPH